MSDVEDFLSAALRNARSDPAWDVTPRRVDLNGVRRAAHARRRRVRYVAVTSGLALLLGGGLAGLSLDGGHSETLRPAAPPATAPAPAPVPTPVPSVTPAWRPTSARDWILTHEQYLTFTSTHQVERPTAPPPQLASPAPLTPATAALEAQARAGLPAGSTLDRDDAPAGEPGVAALHVTLPDRTPLEVQQRQLTEPQDQSNGPAVMPVPGSTDLYSTTTNSVGYSFPGQRRDGVHAVHVFDSHGRITAWYAPTTVPLTTLTSWALAAIASQ